MSVDIMESSGVIVDIKTMNNLVRDKDIAKIIATFLEYVETWDNGLEPEWRELRANMEPLANALKEGMTAAEFTKAMEDTVKLVEKKNWAWGNDHHAGFWAEVMTELWNDFISKTRPDFPGSEVEVRGFDSYSTNGYDVPIGKVCFVFGEGELWERRLTEKGEEFKKLMGTADEVRWTMVSC